MRDGEWEHLAEYSHGTYDEAAAKLRKDLEQEAARKYDFIIERTVSITGEITDASALTVGAKGDLNGYIEGKDGNILDPKGTAKRSEAAAMMMRFCENIK